MIKVTKKEGKIDVIEKCERLTERKEAEVQEKRSWERGRKRMRKDRDEMSMYYRYMRIMMMTDKQTHYQIER